MKIALIANDAIQQFPLLGYGGIESSVESTAEGLSKRDDLDFFVIAPTRKKKEDYPFEIIEVNNSGNPHAFAYRCSKILKKMNFDIIWSQSFWSADVLSELNKPIICTFQDSCEKQMDWIKPFPNVKYRFISSFHFNNWVKEDWEKEASFFCYTSLKDEEFRLYSKEERGNYNLWVGGLAWGLAAKGLDVFIQEAEKSSEDFVIYGGGNEFLANLIREKSKQFKNIFYEGELPRGEKHREVFGRAKSFWMPTRLPEALGRTTLEALSKGTPVLASKNGANPELINKKNGQTFDFFSFGVDRKTDYDHNTIFEESKIFSNELEVERLWKESIKILG